MTRYAFLGAGVAVAVAAQAGRHGPKKAVVHGFSVKTHVLGQKVYNDRGELVGRIEDLIFAKRIVSHAVVAVGGFLGVGKYAVAIPASDFIRSDERIVLPGASKEAIRAMPRFESTRVVD